MAALQALTQNRRQARDSAIFNNRCSKLAGLTLFLKVHIAHCDCFLSILRAAYLRRNYLRLRYSRSIIRAIIGELRTGKLDRDAKRVQEVK
jgi:hypothetical protein